MTGPIILCADGSELSNRALAAGLAVARPGAEVIVVTGVSAADPTLVTGTGMAGGTMTPEQFAAYEQSLEAEGRAVVAAVVAELGLDGASTAVLPGDPGAAICEFATAQGASAIVIGSRGRGGFKRALLGSVSDYVVRNAPCPVIVTGSAAADT